MVWSVDVISKARLGHREDWERKLYGGPEMAEGQRINNVGDDVTAIAVKGRSLLDSLVLLGYQCVPDYVPIRSPSTFIIFVNNVWEMFVIDYSMVICS